MKFTAYLLLFLTSANMYSQPMDRNAYSIKHLSGLRLLNGTISNRFSVFYTDTSRNKIGFAGTGNTSILYTCTMDENGGLLKEPAEMKEFNSTDNYGQLTVGPAGYIFTKCDHNTSYCDIAQYTFEKKREGCCALLNFPHKEEYKLVDPTYCSKLNTLVFSASRKSERADLWCCTWDNKLNSWINFQKLDSLNSPLDEFSPYLAESGNLYFSSNRNETDFDIYMASWNGNGWDEPVKLNYPINSVYDDMSLIINEKKNKGYFVTSRPYTNAKQREDSRPFLMPALNMNEIFSFSLTAPEYKQADTLYYGSNHKTTARGMHVYSEIITPKDSFSGRIVIRSYDSLNRLYKASEYTSNDERMLDGNSLEYFPNGRIYSKKQYSHGRLYGYHKTYWPNQKIKRSDIYRNDTLLDGHCYDTLGQEIKYFPYYEDPVLNISMVDFYSKLAKEIHYPNQCKELGITGKVWVGIRVEANGSISDVFIIRSVHPLLDEEALRAVRKVISSAKPGKRDGIPTQSEFKLPIKFSLATD